MTGLRVAVAVTAAAAVLLAAAASGMRKPEGAGLGAFLALPAGMLCGIYAAVAWGLWLAHGGTS